MTEHATSYANLQRYVSDLQVVIQNISLDDVDRLVQYVDHARRDKRRVFVIGNGGSAATASHMACDLAKTTLPHSGPGTATIRAMSLTDNVPLLTAWGNDVGYSTVFAQQVRNLAMPHDLLIVITASGNSPNILEAVKAARDLGMRTVGLLGFDGGEVKALLDHSVIVRSYDYGQVEDAHMIVNHMITAHFKDVCAT